MFINLISISSICFSCLHHSSFENDKFIELCGMAVSYATFCLDHWYLIIQWTLFDISRLNLCLPFLSFNHNFLSQNSALSCVFESLPELFTLL